VTIDHSQRACPRPRLRKRRHELGRSRRSEARIAVLSGAAFCSPRRRVTHAWRTSKTDTTRITAATSSSTTTVVNHMSRELTNTPHPSPPGRGARVRVRQGPARGVGGISCSSPASATRAVRLLANPTQKMGRHLTPRRIHDRRPHSPLAWAIYPITTANTTTAAPCFPYASGSRRRRWVVAAQDEHQQ
jgi:hypothetical protein